MAMPKKKKLCKPKKSSIRIYEELRHSCAFILACEHCRPKGAVAHNYHGDCSGELLMGCSLSDQRYHFIRKSPKNYGQDRGLCEHSENKCLRGNACSYPHSDVERRVWRGCLEHNWSVQQFQKDVRTLSLKHSQIGLWRNGLSLKNVCKRCLRIGVISEKKKHTPLCSATPGHNWSNVLIVCEGDRYMSLDSLNGTTASDAVQKAVLKLNSILENGFTMTQIWEEYTSLKQGMEHNCNQQRSKNTPSRRIEFDYYPPKEPKKQTQFDTHFEDIIDDSDIDSEHDLDSEDEEIYTRRSPYYDEIPEERCTELLVRQPEKYKLCRIHLEGSQNATCQLLNENGPDIKITGRHNCGRAFDGDEVVVEVVTWVEKETDLERDVVKFDAEGHVIAANKEKDVEAAVMHKGGIVKRVMKSCTKRTLYVFACVVDEYAANLMVPLCLAPKIHVLDNPVHSHNRDPANFNCKRVCVCKRDENGQIKNIYDEDNQFRYEVVNPAKRHEMVFIVKYEKWGRHYVYPFGYVAKVIKAGTDLKKAILILNLKYQLPRRCQDAVSVKDYEGLLDKIITDCSDRIDLTELNVFSIDPSGSRDIDDALSVEYICNKKATLTKVGIHISDVTALVQKGSDVDKSAAVRRVSYYGLGPEDTVHMLPDELATNLCSLLENKKRLAISCFLFFDQDGHIVKRKQPKFLLSIIENKQQLTYGKANKIMMSKEEDGIWLHKDLNTLYNIAQKLRENRKFHPAMNTDTQTINFGSSDGDSVESHILVEEFMIIVNTIAAEAIAKADPQMCILRKQERPKYDERAQYKQRFKDIINTLLFIKPFDIYLPEPKQTQNQLSSSMDRPRDVYLTNAFCQRLHAISQDNDFYQLASLLSTYELMPSAHVAQVNWRRIQNIGEISMMNDRSDKRHFELQKETYTWFSSPIRRFVDMVNHRVLKSVISDNTVTRRRPYAPGELDIICSKFNKTHHRQRQYSNELARARASNHLKSFPFYFPCPVLRIDEADMELAIPFLKNTKKKETTLTYGHLALSGRPCDQRTGMTLQWERRIYEANTNDKSHSRGDKDDVKYVNSEWHTPKPRKDHFDQIVRAVLQHDHISAFQMAQRILTVATRNTSPEITSEMKAKIPIVKHHAKFNTTLSPANVLQVQVGAHCDSGMLGLHIDRICLSNNLALCTQHMRDPISCFASIAEKKSKTLYRDIQEYQETWLPILAMEAITNAAQNGDPVIVHNVEITIMRHNNEYFGRIEFERNFLRERAIHFITHESEDEEDSQDYLCLKIPLDASNRYLPKGNQRISQYIQWRNHWVAHALVTKVVAQENTEEGEGMSKDMRTKKKSRSEDDQHIDKENVVVEFQLHEFREIMTSRLLDKDGRGTHMGSIEFLSKVLPDRRMYNAVVNLEKANELCTSVALGTILEERNIHMDKEWKDLIPEDSLDIEVKKAKDKNGKPLPLYPNNPMQVMAIQESLKRRFTIIQGPPGTGKTITGVKLLYWYSDLNARYQRSSQGTGPKLQVMYCAPSNSAVDVAARALYVRLAEQCPKIVRVFSESIHKQAFPIPRELTSSNRLRPYEGFSEWEMRKYALHYLIRNENNQGQRAIEIKSLDQKFRSIAPEKIEDADIAKYQDLVKKASIDELSKYDIILCTCSVSASPRIQRGCNIRQCVIDESGMCMEPETIVPLVSLDPQPEQVVLIGDHKQLRPIVMNNTARRLGLEKSLFERYAVMKTTGLIMLNEQYRMNESICEFPSKYFYEGKLITRLTKYWKASGELPQEVWPKRAPFVFCHVEGSEETMTVATPDGNEQSKWNKQDARQTIRIFLAFTNDLDVQYKRITILSQYKAQVKYIEKELKKMRFPDPNVSTVVSSQGDEWDYVILSTVRSLPSYQIDKRPSEGWLKRNLGFIKDHNQINVAITRARKGLVIVGNQHLLRCDNDPQTGLWNHLLDFYSKRGCLVDANAFPVRDDESLFRERRMVDEQAEEMLRVVEEKHRDDVLLPVLPPRLKKKFKKNY